MSRIAAMKVSISADTGQFDAAMAKSRGQLRGLQRMSNVSRAAAPGLGQMGMGGLGRLGGMARMGPAGLAVGATVGLIAAGVKNIHNELKQQRKDRDEMAELGMTPKELAMYQTGAQAVFGESGTAGQMRSAQDAFKNLDQTQRGEMHRMGVTADQMSGLMSDDLPAFLDALQSVAQTLNVADRRKIADMVGGPAGVGLMRSAMIETGQYGLGQRVGRAPGAESAAIADAELREQERVNRLLESGQQRDSLGLSELYRLMEGRTLSREQELAVLRNIDRKISGPPA
jgi:hypothetical protein